MIDLVQVKQHWGTLAKIAVWVTAMVGLFLLPPPRLWPSSSEIAMTSDPTQWMRLSQFLVAVVVGLFFLRANNRIARSPWRVIAIGAAVLGVALFVAAQFLTPEWTCGYINEVVIRGTSLSEDAQQLLASGAKPDCSQLIGLAAGETRDVWSQQELVARYMILAGIYTVTMIAFAAAALATVEFIRRGQTNAVMP